jgi:hypothetical protein
MSFLNEAVQTPVVPLEAIFLSLPSNRRRMKSVARLTASCAALAALSACAGGAKVAQGPSTDYYISHAAGNYTPPGPPGDPWGPYIKIAADRFDVPQQWIRQVMRAESGGHEYMGGQLTVSPAGAMGLMQLEPETYQEMASRYSLGSDPFNPYDNIMAGTAYIHEMYAVYGSPGFLAAYNAGPGRLDSFENNGRKLPHETTHYVAMIAPNIAGYYPNNRSQADQLAMNTVSMSNGGLVPYGMDPGRQPAPDSPGGPAVPVEVADLAPPPKPDSAVYSPGPAPSAPAPTPSHHFSLISSAMADTPAPNHSYGPASPPAATGDAAGWAIQVGAYNTPSKARAALGIAELSAVNTLMHGHPTVISLNNGSGTVYRARYTGLPHADAVDACGRLAHGPTGCVVLSPDAQS